jgi:hypothetical protein
MSAPMRVLGLIVLVTICTAGRVSADLTGDAYERFYNRYVGTWKANVAKSRYLVGESPKEGNSFTAVNRLSRLAAAAVGSPGPGDFVGGERGPGVKFSF